MADWIELLNQRLSTDGRSTRVRAAYGHTGNFVVTSEASRKTVASEITEVLGTVCAVVSLSELTGITDRLRQISPDNAQSSTFRHSPGAAFHVCGDCRSHVPNQTRLARYVERTAGAVLLLKHDPVTPRGVLNRDRRMGGWGAVATEVGRMLGGQWTARSGRTLSGVVRLLHRAEAEADS
jgi:hypothetical protein